MSTSTASAPSLHKPIDVTWRDVMSLCAVYWFSQPKRLAVVMGFVFAMVVLDILFPITAGLLVDRIVTAIQAGEGFDPAYRALCLYMAVVVLFFIVRNVRSRIWNVLAARNMAQLLEDTFAKVQKFSSDWHANTFAGATVRKITRGKWAYDAISEILWMNFLPQGLMVIGVTAVMIVRYPSVGLMFAVGVVIHVGASILVASRYVRPANVRAAGADSAIGAAVADAMTNNAAVKSFGAEIREEARFRNTVLSWREKAIVAWTRGWDLIFVQQVIWRFMQFLTIFMLIGLASRGQATAGDIVFMLTLNSQLGGYLRQVGDHIRQLQRATSEFADVVDFHARPLQIADQAQAPSLRREEGRIEFSNVTFGYEASGKPLYDQFNLTIQPGERVGLVGPSGSGKSTFVKLIQRLYDVDKGAVMIDGQNIDAVSQTSLRSSVALVPQDPLLFHRSLSENIAYARPEASKGEIKEAARRARASEFIDRLPLGYDTLVGERGVKLSGGERQRVAIARAFIADAPIVIFDEATSSLDTITERLIQGAMRELMLGRTTIIVAHRLSTVKDVDRILVFDRGRIVEQGCHQDLIRVDSGRYRALYEMQDVAA